MVSSAMTLGISTVLRFWWVKNEWKWLLMCFQTGLLTFMECILHFLCILQKVWIILHVHTHGGLSSAFVNTQCLLKIDSPFSSWHAYNIIILVWMASKKDNFSSYSIFLAPFEWGNWQAPCLRWSSSENPRAFPHALFTPDFLGSWNQNIGNGLGRAIPYVSLPCAFSQLWSQLIFPSEIMRIF